MLRTVRKRSVENIFIVAVLLLLLLVWLPPKLMMGKDSGKDSESRDFGVLFEDDFALPSPLGQWHRENLAQESGKNIAVSANGAYRIRNPSSEESSLFVLAPKPSTIEDASVEVDAVRVGDDSDDAAGWGVVCRASLPKSNFYVMGILNTGSPYIYKHNNGNITLLAVDAPTDAINKDGSANHIRGDCIGNKLALYVNDQKMLETEDAEFASGGVGLSVEGADISFDNFLVSGP